MSAGANDNDYTLSLRSSSCSSSNDDRGLRVGASFASCASVCADHQWPRYLGCAEVAPLALGPQPHTLPLMDGGL